MIVANHQHTHIHLAFQHLSHKVVGTHHRHLGSKLKQHHLLNAHSLQQHHLFVLGCEQLNGELTSFHLLHHTTGRDVERDANRSATNSFCLFHHLTDEELMTFVYSIKKTYRCYFHDAKLVKK